MRALTPEGSNPTAPQQSRFGGDEATVLENQALRQDFFAHSPAAGVSFYPHRVSTQVRGRRSPGQMPWRTVLYGSIVLCCVWFGGLLWAMLKTWYQIDVVLMNPDAGDKLEAVGAFFSRSPWNHRFFFNAVAGTTKRVLEGNPLGSAVVTHVFVGLGYPVAPKNNSEPQYENLQSQEAWTNQEPRKQCSTPSS